MGADGRENMGNDTERPVLPVIERRMVPLEDAEVRQDNGSVNFKGHAAVFNRTTDLGPFREKVAPGAFKKTIKEADVRFLFNHGSDTVMARTRSGTLRLKEDKTGLATDADLDPTDVDVQRILPKMRRGDLDQMSFAFRVVGPQGQSWDDDPEDGGPPIRTLREVELFDVSVVTFPAYSETDAQIGRSVEQVYELRQHERALKQFTKTFGIEDEEPEPDEPEVTEPEEQEAPAETEREEEPQEEPSEPRRDDHALAEARALRQARIDYIEEMLKHS